MGTVGSILFPRRTHRRSEARVLFKTNFRKLKQGGRRRHNPSAVSRSRNPDTGECRSTLSLSFTHSLSITLPARSLTHTLSLKQVSLQLAGGISPPVSLPTTPPTSTAKGTIFWIFTLSPFEFVSPSSANRVFSQDSVLVLI